MRCFFRCKTLKHNIIFSVSDFSFLLVMSKSKKRLLILVFSVCNKSGKMIAGQCWILLASLLFVTVFVKARDMNLTLQPILQTKISTALTSSTILHKGYFLFIYYLNHLSFLFFILTLLQYNTDCTKTGENRKCYEFFYWPHNQSELIPWLEHMSHFPSRTTPARFDYWTVLILIIMMIWSAPVMINILAHYIILVI